MVSSVFLEGPFVPSHAFEFGVVVQYRGIGCYVIGVATLPSLDKLKPLSQAVNRIHGLLSVIIGQFVSMLYSS